MAVFKDKLGSGLYSPYIVCIISNADFLLLSLVIYLHWVHLRPLSAKGLVFGNMETMFPELMSTCSHILLVEERYQPVTSFPCPQCVILCLYFQSQSTFTTSVLQVISPVIFVFLYLHLSSEVLQVCYCQMLFVSSEVLYQYQ